MKIIAFFTALFLAQIGQARDLITIVSPYSASHSGTPALMKIVEQANVQQNIYQFIVEFKPGAEQLLAVKHADEQPQSRLAIVAPKYVEHTVSGKLNRNNYVPVFALGDACWAVITNVGDEKRGVSSLRGQKELVVGGVGFGNSAHLTALQLGEKYGFTVRYVPFKSNFDALVLLAGDQSVNMVLERVNNAQQMKSKNPNIKILGMSCPVRHPDVPEIKTLKEQNIHSPYVFNIVVANNAMPKARRTAINQILENAARTVGEQTIQKISDMRPPMFDQIPLSNYYNNSIATVENLLKKHEATVKAAINGK